MIPVPDGEGTMAALLVTLSYSGRDAENNEIDLYDIGQALIGFQRSLALTTHLVLNDEIITQAPSLSGAQIFALPATDGSWKLTAQVTLIAAALYHLGTAPKDTVIGNLISSAYDYVISETLGFHIDYNKTLGQQFEEQKKAGQQIIQLPQSRFDSLTEKCEVAIRDMHRPIVKSQTASEAKIIATIGSTVREVGKPLNYETYEYVAYTDRGNDAFQFVGRVSSYNSNTFKGRVYVANEGRPVPFELSDMARGIDSVAKITASLAAYAQRKPRDEGNIVFNALRNNSRSGRLKNLYIIDIL
jgi:hypothetical protein